MSERDKVERLRLIASEIVKIYEEVATGETMGASGCFYADGKGTLNAVQVPVELLEKLADAIGRKVHPRTFDYRKRIKPQS